MGHDVIACTLKKYLDSIVIRWIIWQILWLFNKETILSKTGITNYFFFFSCLFSCFFFYFSLLLSLFTFIYCYHSIQCFAPWPQTLPAAVLVTRYIQWHLAYTIASIAADILTCHMQMNMLSTTTTTTTTTKMAISSFLLSLSICSFFIFSTLQHWSLQHISTANSTCTFGNKKRTYFDVYIVVAYYTCHKVVNPIFIHVCICKCEYIYVCVCVCVYIYIYIYKM